MRTSIYIHVFEGVTEDHLAAFFSNVIGSKHFNLRVIQDVDCYKPIADTPQIWIGEVSWLKAALGDDEELKAALGDDEDSYVPNAVGKVSELVGEDLPILTTDFLDKIIEALNIPTQEAASNYRTAQPYDVEAFLRPYIGKKLFTVSW